jgi:hypothetical protein
MQQSLQPLAVPPPFVMMHDALCITLSHEIDNVPAYDLACHQKSLAVVYSDGRPWAWLDVV